MPKTKRALWAILATTAAAGGLADADGASRTISVPGDFQTVQAAIDAARGDDTIVVTGGTYAENLVVSGWARRGLQIYANEGATIVGRGDAAAITVTSSDVGLHGFVVRSGGDGVVVSGARNVQVDGVTVADAGGDAFRATGSIATTFESNLVDVAAGAGFHVERSSGTTIYANDVGGVNDGLVVESSHGVSACSNTFDGVDDAAVVASDSTDLVVDESYMSDVGRTGFDVQNVQSVYLGGNTLDDSRGASRATGDGIHVESSSGVDINGNSVFGALGRGVAVLSSDAEIANTEVAQVGGDGIYVGPGDAGSLVEFNMVEETGGSGVVVLSDRTTVAQNTIRTPGGDGVMVTGAEAVVTGNQVHAAGHDGVCLLNQPGDAPSNVADNAVWSPAHDGVELGATCGATVTGNMVTHAGANGVELGAGDENVLHQNRATKSRNFDLYEGDAAAENQIDKTNKFKRAHRRGQAAHHHHHHHH